MVNNRSFFALTFLCLFSFLINPAIAAKGVPILVEVSFEVMVLRQAWGNSETNRIQQEASLSLSNYLNNTYPYWNFHHDLSNTHRRLRFRVVDVIANTVEIYVEAYTNSHRDNRWICTWLKPGDKQAGRYPTLQNVLEKLERAVDDLLMREHLENIHTWLKEVVPLAKSGFWLETGDPYKLWITLSLPYEEYINLSESVFHIAGELPSGSREKIEAIGTGISAPYPPKRTPPKYKGIVVAATKQISGGQHIDIDLDKAKHYRELKLGPVYLADEIHPSGQDLFLFEDDEP
jgi:hypothetical protein